MIDECRVKAGIGVRRVVYAVNQSASAECDELIVAQLATSLDGLRRHNPSLPVTILLYGEVALEGLDAEIRRCGSYSEALGPYAATLGDYPVLHKWLGVSQLDIESDDRVLYLDSDTCVFGDLAALFDTYAERSFYAREEPFTMRSSRGYDPTYVDELALTSLAQSQGCRVVPPYNLGVVMLNHGLCRRLGKVMPEFLSFAERFKLETLNYPSGNRWIIEQVALWLALGRLADFSHGLMSPEHVLQDTEFLSAPAATVVHYFSGNSNEFFAWYARIGATDRIERQSERGTHHEKV